MSPLQAITWDIARAGGFTAYALLTLSVAIGLALTMHWQSPKWPRIINSELHNFLTLVGLVFTIVHVLAVWVDPFTHFEWNEIFLPLASHYRPLWMALGIVALYLGIAIAMSTWLRPRIGYTWWRRLHVFTLLVYVLVTLHGIATGSDTQTIWGIGIYMLSVLLVGTLLCTRLLVPATPRGRSHPLFAALTALLLVVGIVWTAVGPLQSGWSAKAGTVASTNTSTSGATSQSVQQSTNQKPFSTPFTASVQGTLTQNGPDANGNETLRLETTFVDGTQGTLVIVLQGQQGLAKDDDNGGLAITSTQVLLGSNANEILYSGPLTLLNNERYWNMAATLSPTGANANRLQVQINLRISDNGQIDGSVQGSPVSISPAPTVTDE